MSSRDKDSDTDQSGPPPSLAIIFTMGCLGAFHGLIALVDPFL